ncbi:LuxR C-terminal-related transcriptional regulator [Streptomyces sp. JJ36]|uniref:helix-turn-helix transcriptional regulator n=1 Tax=Streptomyces sp. JJ36 TaxID=2736645 RepID=UPI0027E49FC8|nr:LuxR C-terminal-related transcriptional regulator [Streptomyces sp. JJ36]MCF6525699.1 hypothetical protein [Streptomyces sp. JJ36]
MTGPTTPTSPLRNPARSPARAAAAPEAGAAVAAVEALLDRLAADPARAGALLRGVPGPAAGDALRGRAALAHGLLELRNGPLADARELLRLAAALLAGHDPVLALDALLAAAEAAWSAGDVAAHRATLAAAPAHGAGPLEDYRAGMAAVMGGSLLRGTARLRQAVARTARSTDPGLLLRGCLAALVLGEVGTARDTAARALALARAGGRHTVVPQALEYLAYTELRAGQHARARAHAAEGLAAACRARQANTAAQLHAVRAMAASVEGTAEECAAHAHAATRTAVPHGLGVAHTLALWALARADLAAGRPAEAVARLGPLVRRSPRAGHYAARMLAVPCFVEAAVLAETTAGVGEALAEFTVWAGWTADPQAPGQLARCRALLAPAAQADRLYARALDHHDRAGGEFERARTLLLHGKALRRGRRLLAARDRLREARTGFERCGARVWAEQAVAELRATGEATPGATGGGSAGRAELAALTPQQLRIARCVAEGCTNREVALRLSVSPRTVEHHLRNVFATLGVRSRVELARLVDCRTDGPPPGP